MYKYSINIPIINNNDLNTTNFLKKMKQPAVVEITKFIDLKKIHT